ncbi:MAG: hypothetical protein IJ129_06280 [Ruminococcus sp.]|nr:hypothetical protein [Ruminococcus sp.]
MPFTAFAAEEPAVINEKSEPQTAQAQITTEIAPAYIVTIPADTKVAFNALDTDFGRVELTQARLEPHKVVRVHLDSDYKLKNKADESKTIPYDIVSTDDGGKTGSLKRFDAQLEFQGDVCPLRIKITQEDWNAAAAGEYSDTVTFNVQYTDAASNG